MFDVYTKCSRCGEMFVADRVDRAATFESVTFSGVSVGGLTRTNINRLNKQNEELFRSAYPLCPDCMADTLDFVRGRYRMITHEDVCECEASNDGIE